MYHGQKWYKGLGVKKCQGELSKKSESGIYHIMLRGTNKQVLFEDEEDRTKLLCTLREYKIKSGYRILGYCLVDNHIHLLIQEGRER